VAGGWLEACAAAGSVVAVGWSVRTDRAIAARDAVK